MAYVDDLFGDDNLLGDPNDLDNLVEYRDAGNNSDVEAEDRAGMLLMFGTSDSKAYLACINPKCFLCVN